MTRLLPADVEKEFRALALPWLAAAAAIVLGSAGVPLINGFEVGAYFLGVSVLGGLAMGQEYSNRTLGAFLTLPVQRQRMFVVKLGVLAILLVALDAIMWTSSGDVRAIANREPGLLMLPTLCALFVAPWLTMWSRSALAGAVLAGGLPGTVFVATQLAVYWMTGDVLNEASVLKTTTPIVCAVGAIVSWRMFMRLEAIDGGGRDLRLPSWSSAAIDTVTRHNPAWLLIKKEIGLQQITLALSGVLVAGWMVAMTLRDRVDHMADIFNIMTLFYAGSMALMIGAIASAEERQFGTHEWQALLPMSAARQWRIKVVVVLALTLILSVLLPSVLMTFMGDSRWRLPLMAPGALVGAGVAATLGLYFSSLTTSSVRALVIAVPAIALGFLPGVRLNSWEEARRFFYGTWLRVLYEAGYSSLSYAGRARVSSGIELLLAVAFIAMVLRFALTNHRSAAPIGPHLWRQGLAIGLCLSAAAFIVSVRLTFGID